VVSVFVSLILKQVENLVVLWEIKDFPATGTQFALHPLMGNCYVGAGNMMDRVAPLL